MAIGANSYGNTTHIGSLVPQHTNESGVFSQLTNPTLTAVETEVDFISSIMNSILATEGFSIPVTQADAVEMLAGFVNRTVAEVVKAIRGGGRYGPLMKEGRKSLNHYLLSDIREFIELIADGLENLGAVRDRSVLSGIAFRDVNNAGEETFPLFQRDAPGSDLMDFDPYD